jgi:hypothetical protein
MPILGHKNSWEGGLLTHFRLRDHEVHRFFYPEKLGTLFA